MDKLVQKQNKKIDIVENETFESTIRSLNLLNEARDYGIQTTKSLQEQNETLNKIKSQVDDIHADYDTIQKYLNDLSSFCCFRMSSGCKSSRSSRAKPWKIFSKKLLFWRSKSKTSKPEPSVKCESAQIITNSLTERKINENLSDISDGVKLLRNMAIEMSNNLNEQNSLIDHLCESADNIAQRSKKQEKKMKKLL